MTVFPPRCDFSRRRTIRDFLFPIESRGFSGPSGRPSLLSAEKGDCKGCCGTETGIFLLMACGRKNLPDYGPLLPICAPALSQAILSERLGRRPGRNGLSAVSSAQGQGLWTLALTSSWQRGHFASAIWKFLSAFALEATYCDFCVGLGAFEGSSRKMVSPSFIISSLSRAMVSMYSLSFSSR